jgi:hypothetical protein
MTTRMVADHSSSSRSLDERTNEPNELAQPGHRVQTNRTNWRNPAAEPMVERWDRRRNGCIKYAWAVSSIRCATILVRAACDSRCITRFQNFQKTLSNLPVVSITAGITPCTVLGR